MGLVAAICLNGAAGQIQDAVRQSATSAIGSWDPDLGFGIIDAGAAYALV